MNTDSESSSNSRILPFFMVILVLMGAYAFEKRRIRTLSLQSKAKLDNNRAYYLVTKEKSSVIPENHAP